MSIREPELKTQARLLAAEVGKTLGVPLDHYAALHIVARLHGYQDWRHVARAHDAKTADGAAVEWSQQVAAVTAACDHGRAELPGLPRIDWAQEAAAGNTTRSYWDWVTAELEAAGTLSRLLSGAVTFRGQYQLIRNDCRPGHVQRLLALRTVAGQTQLGVYPDWFSLDFAYWSAGQHCRWLPTALLESSAVPWRQMTVRGLFAEVPAAAQTRLPLYLVFATEHLAGLATWAVRLSAFQFKARREAVADVGWLVVEMPDWVSLELDTALPAPEADQPEPPGVAGSAESGQVHEFRYVREQRHYFQIRAATATEAQRQAEAYVDRLQLTAPDDQSDDPGELTDLAEET